MRQRIFAVGEQQLVQVGVRAEDPRFRGVAWESDIIDRRAELESRAVLDAAGRTDIPVVPGQGVPLSGKLPDALVRAYSGERGRPGSGDDARLGVVVRHRVPRGRGVLRRVHAVTT